MNGANSGFDRLSRWYRPLEYAAFGRDLERARFAFLGSLAACRDILLLGEGDGRCAERLAALAPAARIHCVDSSRGMIERASERIGRAGAGARVTFECTDALAYRPAPGAHDAVATLFFLDCFDEAGVESIVGRIGASLRPGAPWLFADFVTPRGWPGRLRARAWLCLLYAFFRLAAGLRVTRLPPSEEVLSRHGWVRTGCLDLQHAMLRSALYERPPAVPQGPY